MYIYLVIIILLMLLTGWAWYRFYSLKRQIRGSILVDSPKDAEGSGTIVWTYNRENRTFAIKEGDGTIRTIGLSSLAEWIYPSDMDLVDRYVDKMNVGSNESIGFTARIKTASDREFGYFSMFGLPVKQMFSGEINRYHGVMYKIGKFDFDEEESLLKKKIAFALKDEYIPIEWDRKAKALNFEVVKSEESIPEFSGVPNPINITDFMKYVHVEDMERTKAYFDDLVRDGAKAAETLVLRFDSRGIFERNFELKFAATGQLDSDKYIGRMKIVSYYSKLYIPKGSPNRVFFNILNNFPFPVHIIDVEDNYRYIFWNKESTRVFGNLLGKHAAEVVSPECVAQTEGGTYAAFTSGEPISQRETVVLADGRRLDTIVTKFAIADNDERYVLVVRWDIGETVKLKNKDRLLTSMVDNLNGVTWTCDLRSGVISLGDGARKMGLATQEYTTIDAVREMVYPDDIEKFDALCEMYKQGSREAADVKILQFRMDFSKDGIYQWWESRSILENDDERRLKGSIYGILISIQEQKNIERQLSDALAKAQESERLKSAFLANISHELRTPLNAIVGFSDLITNADDKESRAEYSEIISYNNKLLVRLIENVLTMANLEAGTIRLHITEFDLSRLLEDAYKTMQLRVMQLRVELKKSIPEGEYLITSDRERLVQIVMNYLTNAIKYTEKGNITLGYVKRDSGVELYVTDTGIGIPEDKKDKVFSRFSKLDEFAPGNGLGLSISKALSEKLGGEVGFDSVYGKGSKFWVWVPESYNGEIEE